MWAAAILAKMLPKGKLFGHKIAFFGRITNLYQTVNSGLISLEYFDTFQGAEEHVERLNAYQPTILVAPASMLLELAKQVQVGNLQIAPSKVVSSGQRFWKSRIGRGFKQDLVRKRWTQVYQATEGFLACTCVHGNLHLNEDIVHVDKNYLMIGAFTHNYGDFKRTSQPIFQYELNDILVEILNLAPAVRSLHGIDRIEGRSDDIFMFENAAGQSVEVFPDFYPPVCS